MFELVFATVVSKLEVSFRCRVLECPKYTWFLVEAYTNCPS